MPCQNYEVSMVYQAKPGSSMGARASNIHLLIQFFLGAVSRYESEKVVLDLICGFCF